MTRLETATAMGAFSAIRAASSRAPSSAWPLGVSRLTRPSSAARGAGTKSPVSANSMAMLRGMRCGNRSSPPAAATRPRLTSGIPNLASSAATTRSQASTASNPPASAYPSTAAISGFFGGRWAKPPNPRPSTIGTSPWRNALRSMPAQKVPPAPVMIPTVRSPRESRSSSAAAICSATARFTAFLARGRLMVMTATPSAAS